VADERTAQGARMPDAGGVRMLDADGAGESAGPAADALLPARALYRRSPRARAPSATCTGADTGAGGTSVAAARAPSRARRRG
jgi:hypothetical protein